MNIRKAEERDYSELMNLYNAFCDTDRFSKPGNDSFHRVLNNPNNHVYVAEDAGKVVGFINFTTRDAIRYAEPVIELDELYILPEMRRRGIAKALMKKLYEYAKIIDCSFISIESASYRNEGHAFYEKLGFIKEGTSFILRPKKMPYLGL